LLCAAHPCTLHGVATWFDVLFNGSTSQRWLSTAPGLPATHWFQLRCVLQQPLVVLTPNSRLSGCLRLVAHERQSYDIHLELEAPPIGPGMPPQKVCGGRDVIIGEMCTCSWALARRLGASRMQVVSTQIAGKSYRIAHTGIHTRTVLLLLLTPCCRRAASLT
jgi:hypothetical protein